jgi:hypothetical protein
MAEVRATALLPTLGVVLHGLGLLSAAVLFWWFFVTASSSRTTLSVSAAGAADLALATVLRAPLDTIDVVLHGVPDPRTRALLRALRGSGRPIALSSPGALPGLAVSVEERWRSAGGARLQVVGADSMLAMRDAAGVLDSIALDSAGVQVLSGPVQGALVAAADRVRASTVMIAAGAPDTARVLVAGNATWESKFLIAALEESGWLVDAAVTVSPRVTIAQGAARIPSRARHAIVILLPGAPSLAVAALPAFVRDGGGAVLVGEAARAPGLASLRAGVPGATLAGELGAEASDQPRHGLDLVPITALAPGAVALESRDGRTAIAARRVGAGRVMQVGYDNSWLWRMAGNDDALAAHRRWWSSLLAGLVSMRAPQQPTMPEAIHDTLDAAPVAALVRDLGVPSLRRVSIAPEAGGVRDVLHPMWLLATSLLSFVAAWIIRRWRGFA